MSSDRKRKASTIRDLFTAQQKPNTKRGRPDPDAKEAAAPPAMSTAAMYHFTSKKSDVVDITSSPENSPARKAKAAPNMHANSGPKRMLVKNFKLARKVDPKVFLDQTWSKIDAALDVVFKDGDINFSLEELYRGVENLCRQGLAKDACDRLVVKCREHITGTLKTKVKETMGRKDVDVLRAALGAWATWGAHMVCSSACMEGCMCAN
jgi:cullin-4